MPRSWTAASPSATAAPMASASASLEPMPVCRELRDRPARDEVHDERRLVLVEDGVADRDDVRVADRLHGRGFTPETLAGALVVDQVRVEALDRDHLAGPLIVGAPDRGHAPHGACFEQAVSAPQQSSVHRVLVPRRRVCGAMTRSAAARCRLLSMPRPATRPRRVGRRPERHTGHERGTRPRRRETTVPRSPVAAAWELLHRFVPRGAILLSTLTFIGYFLGLVRERILSQTFGIGDELDAFKAAFLIPELLFSVIVASGLAAPFIPVFTGLKRDEGEPAAHDFGRSVLTLAVLVMGIVSVVLFIVAPLTADLVVPGFDAAKRDLYIDLFRVMCFTQVLFAGSMALGEVLIAERRFFFYGAAPLLYNLGIVIGTVLLVDLIGHLRAGSRRDPRGVDAPRHPAHRDLAARPSVRGHGCTCGRPRSGSSSACSLPKAAGGPLEPLLFIFFTSLASSMAVGSVTVIDQARNFQSLPVSLIGVTFALAAFPTLAVRYAAHDRPGFTSLAVRNSITIGVLTVGAAIGLIVLRPDRHRHPARRRRVRPRRRRAAGAGAGGVRAVRAVREPGAPVEPGDLRDAPHPVAGRGDRGRVRRSRS